MNDQTSVSAAEKVPVSRGNWLQRLLSFVGPAYLVSVGYMDPGNWATDIEGGARFGYALIWVLVMSNMMAILLQTLAARLGIVTRNDLAQGCRKEYPKFVGMTLWALAETAIAATDLAEVIGTIIGLKLLFHIPLLWGCAITACDTLLFLVLQRFGVRKLEAFIVTLVATIGVCFIIEVFLSQPDWAGVADGFIPRMDASMLYIVLGIIGATVMPHNLYLHSSLVQSRQVSKTVTGRRDACRFNFVDSIVALNAAFFVNAAILITSAASFHSRGIMVTEIEQAHALLDSLLGHTIAPAVFAVALLAAGQSSTVTGTISGQIIMEGFLNIRMIPWLRRLATRLIALVPAVVAIGFAGSQGVYKLLILSQVVLSLQLPFAIVPLIHFTADRKKMGMFVNPRWLTVLAWGVAFIIIILNIKLITDELSVSLSGREVWLWMIAIPLFVFLGIILGYLLIRPLFKRTEWETGVITDSQTVAGRIDPMKVTRIGIALQHSPGDAAILSAALSIAKSKHVYMFLIHVVDAPGVLMLGNRSDSLHAAADEAYLEELVREVEERDLHVEPVLCFGRPSEELVKVAGELRLDMLVIGSHGHWGLQDIVFGETITSVRHQLKIPILIVHAGEKETALRLPQPV